MTTIRYETGAEIERVIGVGVGVLARLLGFGGRIQDRADEGAGAGEHPIEEVTSGHRGGSHP